MEWLFIFFLVGAIVVMPVLIALDFISRVIDWLEGVVNTITNSCRLGNVLDLAYGSLS